MKRYAMPSSRRNLIGATHERCTDRKRSHFSATLRRGSPLRTSPTDGFGNRADECFARGGRAPSGVGGNGVRDQHRIWETRFSAYLHRTGAATASESGAIPCLRRWHTAQRSGDARDDAAARERAGEGIERVAAAGGRDALPDTERQGASAD